MNKRVLCISDMHHPYAHADCIDFLRAIKRKYKPDRVICLGDEIDGHAWSFHDADPDLMSPADELQTAINRIKPIYRLFPKVDVIDSNHGSLFLRKLKHHGLPRHILKSTREIMEAPRGWKWHFDLYITLSDGRICYFHHGRSGRIGALSRELRCNTVQGHYHEKFGVHEYHRDGVLYFDAHLGCLIDNASLAFRYNKTNLRTPVLGCGIILDGQMKLLPLREKNGRWDRRCP